VILLLLRYYSSIRSIKFIVVMQLIAPFRAAAVELVGWCKRRPEPVFSFARFSSADVASFH